MDSNPDFNICFILKEANTVKSYKNEVSNCMYNGIFE